jgi:hypothetical protein
MITRACFFVYAFYPWILKKIEKSGVFVKNRELTHGFTYWRCIVITQGCLYEICFSKGFQDSSGRYLENIA